MLYTLKHIRHDVKAYGEGLIDISEIITKKQDIPYYKQLLQDKIEYLRKTLLHFDDVK